MSDPGRERTGCFRGASREKRTVDWQQIVDYYVEREDGTDEVNTSGHISTEEARAQGLGGHDTYLGSHLIYHSQINRDAGVVSLCREAMKAFSDTILIQHRHLLAAEWDASEKWMQAGGAERELPWPQMPIANTTLEWINFEYLKIVAGFEIGLKAILLGKDVVLQKIDQKLPDYKDLAKLQRSDPIQKDRLFNISGYRFDGCRNYLPGLKPASLLFSTIVQQPNYRAALELPFEDLDIIDELRAVRNQIHFPADVIETPKLQASGESPASFIIRFINRQLVPRCNELTAQHGLNWLNVIPMT